MASPFNIVGRSSYGLSATPNIGVQAAQQIKPITPVSAVTNPYKGTTSGGPKGFTSDVPWWQAALGQAGVLGQFVTSQTDQWTNGSFDWGDLPGVSQVDAIKRGTLKTFQEMVKDPNTTTSDFFLGTDPIALLGNGTFRSLVNNVTDELPRAQKTLQNVGVKNNEALFWGGLAGDIVADPLTYLTFGGSSAIKAGSRAATIAAKDAAKEAAADLGKAYSKGLSRVAPTKMGEEIGQRYYVKALDETGNINLAEVARAQASKALGEQINNAGKLARSSAQNAAINFDVPFTKITYQFGKKPAVLTRSSPEIKQVGKNALQTKLNNAGLTGTMGINFVNKALGKEDLSKVTYQEYQWLKGEIDRYSKQVSQTPGARFSTSEGRYVLPETITDPVGSFRTNTFIPDMGGSSRIGEKLADVTRSLNPRRIGTAQSGGLVNSYGDSIQNTFGQLRNNTRQLEEGAKRVASAAPSLNSTERKLVEYALEGSPVEAMNRAVMEAGEDVDINKVVEAANFLRAEYGSMATAEKAVGVLDNTRSNYAPHVMANKEIGQDMIARYADDPDLQQIFKVAPGNSFNKKRTSFETFSKLDDFVSNLRAEAGTAARAGDAERSLALQTKADDVDALFERDPVKAYKKRLYTSYRSQTLGKLYQSLKADSLLIDPEDIAKLGDTAQEFTRLDPTEAKKLGVKAGSLMQNDVYKGLMEADKLFNNEGLNKFLDNYTSVNNIWKSITTSYRPVHHFNNLVGNVFNNTLAGVNIKDYSKATAVMNRMFRGKPKQEDLNLMKELADQAILGQAHSEEYRRLFGDSPNASVIRKTEKFVTDNKLINSIRRWLGDTTDNWSRIAHYIHVKDASGSSEIAANSVRKYLFAYGENTSADRAIRLVVPFWTWTKNNIPLQLEQIMKQPRYYQTYLKLQDASYESQGEDRMDQAPFIRDDYFKTPWGTFRNPRAPVSDLSNLGKPLKFAVSSSTPAVKIPFELATNTNTFTGKPIDYSLERGGPRDPQATLEYGLSQAPILNDFYKLFTGASSPVDLLVGKELKPITK